jgi:hypothetical protein
LFKRVDLNPDISLAPCWTWASGWLLAGKITEELRLAPKTWTSPAPRDHHHAANPIPPHLHFVTRRSQSSNLKSRAIDTTATTALHSDLFPGSHNVFYRGECKPSSAMSASPIACASVMPFTGAHKKNALLTLHHPGPPLGRSRLRCLLRILTPDRDLEQGQDCRRAARVRAQGEAHQPGKGCLGTEERA